MPPTVLLVCQEELRAQLTLRVLRSAEIEAVRTWKPDEVEAVLKINPDLKAVLCDSRLTPAEAATWVEKWKALPAADAVHFLFLLDRLPPANETELLYAKGASDIWIRPVPDFLLIARLRVWMRQLWSPSPALPVTPVPVALNLVDPETFLLGGKLFLEQADGMFSGCKRFSLYVGVLAVSIAAIDRIASLYGANVRREIIRFLAEELRRIKRKEDLLGRWNDKVLMLASYFPKGESVQSFGHRVLDALQRAQFPHTETTGPLRFTIAGAWGPSPDYTTATEALEEIAFQATISQE